MKLMVNIETSYKYRRFFSVVIINQSVWLILTTLRPKEKFYEQLNVILPNSISLMNLNC